MKITNLVFCVVLTFICACSNEKYNTAKINHTPDSANALNIENLKYAGAVVFEVGTTTKSFDMENSRPTARIFVCIDKTGKNKIGKFDVHFAQLGVVWDVPTVTVNYEFNGKIEMYPPTHAWGEITFKSTTSNRYSHQNMQDENSSYDMNGLFQLEVHGGSIMSANSAFYEVQGIQYYVSSELLRFVKSPANGVHPILDCENQEQTVFVKSELGMK